MTTTGPDWKLRYSRHLALPEFGAEAQQRLASARVLLLGLGGLNSPAALYLAAAGVGKLLLNDFDRVDRSNLQRQILYGDADVGEPKTEAAATAVQAVNPACQVEQLQDRLDTQSLAKAFARCDLVLDGSDNFGTRFAVNAACIAAGKPLVTGAAIRYEGQLLVIDPRNPDSPCYACLYEENGESLEDCQRNGVLGPLTGVIGSLMAVEAVKLLTGLGEPLIGKLLRYDAQSGVFHASPFRKDPSCRICSQC